MQRPHDAPPLQPAVVALAALPLNVASQVLQLAGPDTRQVCRAFRDLHPPLLALAPRGISTPEDLNAAVAALPPTLTSLDLRHCARDLITDATLDALAARLPLLESLALPCTRADTYAAIARLPRLHTFQSPRPWPESPNAPAPWAPLLHPPATRLRSLTLPLDALPNLYSAPPASFPLLASLRLRWGQAGINIAHLAALLTPAPALRALEVWYPIEPEHNATRFDPRHVSPLTTLTALCITVHHPTAAVDLPLDLLAALTALRSLRLYLHPTGTWPTLAHAPANWLRCLTLLTQLQITLTFQQDDLLHLTAQLGQGNPPPVPAQAHLLAQAAEAASPLHLPLLRDLKLCIPNEGWSQLHGLPPGWLFSGGLSPRSFYSDLAAATQLARLVICEILLPEEACLLSRLGALTCLHLLSCQVPEPPAPLAGGGLPGVALNGHGLPEQGVVWVAALAGLRELVLEGVPDADGLLQRVAAGALPHLHTLSLRLLDVSEAGLLLDVLGALQGVLQSLELAHLEEAVDSSVLGALGGLQHLQVLALHEVDATYWDGVELEAVLRLPPSLRRCYLSSEVVAGIHELGPVAEARLGSLAARHPLVAFTLQHMHEY